MSRHAGIHQEMLLKPEHRQNFRRIIVKGFGDVGGHKMELEYENILPSDIVNSVLPDGRCIAASLQAYMCVSDQGGIPRTTNGHNTANTTSGGVATMV